MHCDTETCDTCHQATVEGNNQNGECRGCSGDTSLTHMLTLMSRGITRNPKTGQFQKVSKR